MKRRLLILITLFIPLFLSAQNEAPLVKDFVKKSRGVSSFVLNDDVNVMSINTDNTNTEMVAVKSNMQVLWRTKVAGYAVSAGNFKGKVFVVTASDHSAMRGTTNNFTCYLLDPASGSVSLQQKIYEGGKQMVEEPHFFWAKDGSLFKMVVRQSGITNKLHVGLPGPLALITMYKMAKDFSTTRSLAIIDFDEKLVPISIMAPEPHSGELADIRVNYDGDVFLAWAQKNSDIEIERYARNTEKPASKVNVSLDLRGYEYSRLVASLYMLPSSSEPQVLYGAIAHQNTNKDEQLSVFKADFKTGKCTIQTESLEKDAIKAINKGYRVINKKVDDPDLGWGNDCRIDLLEEHNGKLVICSVKQYVIWGNTSSSFISRAPLLSIYNLDLKLQAHQLIPSSFGIGTAYTMPVATYHFADDKLYLIANAKTGMVEISGMFGVLNLNNGQWERQEYLSKKHMSNPMFVNDATMWYKKGAVACYSDLSFGIGTVKTSCDLQQVNF
ncbi:hypothetical protein C8P68_105409 [Mucilaginibacter yixingensis]|uniref:Uncharacterized protein n=1 Tax=Mucilaginibacter yixingensis TaxID=1295612 RepID=A0A2T5J8V6_9SPHI|nr:hypothetical protein [Mucilaginibacter yixingensis]PTQ95898.1 hypothetical protein C8P68_105409 [Mucilaginibacter yixingensis]